VNVVPHEYEMTTSLCVVSGDTPSSYKPGDDNLWDLMCAHDCEGAQGDYDILIHTSGQVDGAAVVTKCMRLLAVHTYRMTTPPQPPPDWVVEDCVEMLRGVYRTQWSFGKTRDALSQASNIPLWSHRDVWMGLSAKEAGDALAKSGLTLLPESVALLTELLEQVWHEYQGQLWGLPTELAFLDEQGKVTQQLVSQAPQPGTCRLHRFGVMGIVVLTPNLHPETEGLFPKEEWFVLEDAFKQPGLRVLVVCAFPPILWGQAWDANPVMSATASAAASLNAVPGLGHLPTSDVWGDNPLDLQHLLSLLTNWKTMALSPEATRRVVFVSGGIRMGVETDMVEMGDVEQEQEQERSPFLTQMVVGPMMGKVDPVVANSTAFVLPSPEGGFPIDEHASMNFRHVRTHTAVNYGCLRVTVSKPPAGDSGEAEPLFGDRAEDLHAARDRDADMAASDFRMETVGDQRIFSTAIKYPTLAVAVESHIFSVPHSVVKLTVGPVIGKVTADTAVILAECDNEVALTCILRDVLDGATHELSLQMPADRPMVFAFADIKPERRFTVKFKGVANASNPERQGVVETLAPHPPSLNFLCMSMDRPEHLLENANLWNWVWEGESGSRRDIDIMMHMGGQVYSEGVFLESQCLMDRLELLNSMLPPTGAEKAQVENKVRNRLRDIYRFAWNLPSTREALATGSHMMFFSEIDMTGGLWKTPNAFEISPTVKRLAKEVSREYQKQLWDPTCAHAPDSADDSCFHCWSSIGLLFVDMNGNNAQTTGPKKLLSEKQWEFIDESLAQPAMRILSVVTEFPLVWYTPHRLRNYWSVKPGNAYLLNHWAFYHDENLRLIDALFKWKHGAPNREVMLMSMSGCSSPVHTVVRDTTTDLSIQQVSVGTITAHPQPLQIDLHGALGSGGRFTFEHKLAEGADQAAGAPRFDVYANGTRQSRVRPLLNSKQVYDGMMNDHLQQQKREEEAREKALEDVRMRALVEDARNEKEKEQEQAEAALAAAAPKEDAAGEGVVATEGSAVAGDLKDDEPDGKTPGEEGALLQPVVSAADGKSDRKAGTNDAGAVASVSVKTDATADSKGGGAGGLGASSSADVAPSVGSSAGAGDKKPEGDKNVGDGKESDDKAAVAVGAAETAVPGEGEGGGGVKVEAGAGSGTDAEAEVAQVAVRFGSVPPERRPTLVQEPSINVNSYTLVSLVPDLVAPDAHCRLVLDSTPHTIATLGPIIGDVTSDTANIMLEVNKPEKVTCVLTNIQTGDRQTSTLMMPPNVPRVFVVKNLKGGFRYRVSFEGIANADERNGWVSTFPARPMALRISAVADNFPREVLEDDSDLGRVIRNGMDHSLDESDSFWRGLLHELQRPRSVLHAANIASMDRTGHDARNLVPLQKQLYDRAGRPSDTDVRGVLPKHSVWSDIHAKTELSSAPLELAIHLGGQIQLMDAFEHAGAHTHSPPDFGILSSFIVVCPRCYRGGGGGGCCRFFEP
jgi:hypothetical protein